jgi:SAM-dependent methyltransferase
MKLAHSTDRDWQKWGELNPYYGVLSDPKYFSANLTDNSLREFFASGERHVEHVYRFIKTNIQPNFQPVKVLDFGCGVGRIVVPLAQRSQAVVGIDVSPGMLEQARENCARYGASSVRLLHFDELDSLEPASFDLVHSFIVFQHIPVARGELILRRLANLVAEGGVGAIHFSYCNTNPSSVLRSSLKALRQRVGLVNGFANIVRRRPFFEPQMQMNSYSINRIFDILIDAHCSNVHVEFSNHGGFHGAMLYFEKRNRTLL